MKKLSATLVVMIFLAACGGGATSGRSAGENNPPLDAVSGEVIVTVDSQNTRTISPYIFGVNFKYVSALPGGEPWAEGQWTPRVTLTRVGGNTTSTIDWRTGYTNFGGDWMYRANDSYEGDSLSVPGSSFKRFYAPALKDATSILWTVPLLPFVAGDDNYDAAPLDWYNPNRIAASSSYQATFVPADPNRVRAWIPKNPSGATASPIMTGPGYADDFVKWLTVNYPGKSRSKNGRIMLALDNEPDYWSCDFGAKHAWALGWPAGPNTHDPDSNNPFDWVVGPRDASGKPSYINPKWSVKLGHTYHVNRTVEMATAIKDVDSDIDIFGGVFMGYWGLYSLGNMDNMHTGHGIPATFMKYDGYGDGSPQPGVTFPYLEMWAKTLNDSSVTRGGRLVDVLDFHWYHNAFTRDGRDAANSDIADTDEALLNARMQAPRAFWDPGYHSNAEIEWKNGQWGLNTATTNIEAGGTPANFLNRLKQTLAKYPQGPQKLAITEYQFGRAGDISGAVAHADALGVFAREEVYAATHWGMTNANAAGYGGNIGKAFAGVGAAYRAWVDYDGAGHGIGDTYLATTVTDTKRPPDPNRPDNAPSQTLERITAYATVDVGNPNRMVIVAINKTVRTSLNTGFQIAHPTAFKRANVYQITGQNGINASILGPRRIEDIAISGKTFSASLPAQSITIFELKP